MSSVKGSKGKTKGSSKSTSKSRAASKTGSTVRGKKLGEEASHFSEEKLRFIFESIGDGITVIDLSGTIIEVNEAAVRIGGHKSREELIGRNGLEFIKPEERDFAASETMKALGAGSTSETVEYTMVMADGSEKNVQVNVAPLRDNSGKLEGVITVTRDISDRKAIEAELEKAAKKLRLIIESIGDMLFITDMNLNIVNANEAAVRTLGYGSEQELLGQGVTEMVAGKDSARVVVQLGKALADERSGGTVEYTLVSKSGQEFDVEATVEILRDCAAKVVGLIITARDVTERKRMQEEVRASEEKMHTMFETINDGICVIDMEGKIVDMNEAAYRLAGYSSREEIIGINTLAFTAEEDRERVANDMMASLTEGTVAKDLVYKLKRKDGSKFDVEFSASMLKDAEGNPVGFIAVERDVTERRRVEAELEKSAEKLRIVIESIGDMLFITDLDLNLTSVNDAAVRLLGYGDKGRLLGRSFIEHVAERDGTRVAVDMGKALADKKGIEVLEYTMVSADGGEFEVEATTEILRDCASKVVGLIVTARDVTERKRMQEAVRASEEKLRLMFDSIADGLTVTDLNGNMIETNEAAVRLHRFDSKEDMLSRNGIELIAEEDRKRCFENAMRAAKEGVIQPMMEYTMLRKDGERFDGDYTLAPMRGASGDVVGFIAVVRDISERKRMEATVRESEQKLRGVFEAITDGITLSTLEGDIIEMNEAMVKMHGYSSKEELLGKSAVDLVAERDRERVVKQGMQALKEKHGMEAIEYRVVKADGTEFDAEFTTIPMYDESGKPVAWVSVSRDITERKRIREELRKTAENLQVIFDSIADGITVTDVNGTILDVNQSVIDMGGFKGKEELIGTNGFDLMSPDDRDRIVRDTMAAFAESKTTRKMEYSFVPISGKAFDVDLQLSMLLDDRGNPRGFVGITRDISERKRMEQALRESEEELRAMFDSVHDGIIVVDPMGNIQRTNSAALRMTGYTQEELMGSNTLDYVAEEDREKIVADMAQTIESNELTIQMPAYKLVRKDGSILEAEMGTGMLHDSEGNIKGLVGVMRDITERKRMQEAVRESEEKLRVMFESMRDAVILTDLNGLIVEVNDAAVRMHGYTTKDDIIGKNGLELVAERDHKKVIDGAMRQSRGESPGDIAEIHMLLKADGTEFESESSRAMLRDANGKPMGFIAVERDISERKLMEQAIQESEARFRELFENMSSGVAVYEAVDGGKDFMFKDFNAAAEKIGNVKKEEIIGRRVLEVYPGMEEFGLLGVLRKVWKSGKPARMPASYYKDERREGWRDNYVYKLPSGEVIAVYDDITERKKAEDALIESEEKLRAMFESTSDGIVVTDVKFDITDANEAAARIFGFKDREALLGQNALGYLSTQKVVDAEGKEVDIEFSVSQLRDRLGNLAGNIGVVRDISIRKRMEDNLRQTVTDLERSNRDMQQFVYVASHDLQEPLRMISSYTQLLNRRYKGKMDTDADEFIAYAVNGANLLQERIQALATFSRVSTRGKPFAPTDMERVLETALANIGGEIESGEAEITHDPLPTITADGTQMEQVFQYLIDNAIKFRGDNAPKVHVSAEEREDDWVFSVSDNGIGIDPEYHDRIFVIFQRLYGGSYAGTGIGLPVCKKILERHGGSIWVESKQGEGAKFYFSVPKKIQVTEAEAPSETAAPQES